MPDARAVTVTYLQTTTPPVGPPRPAPAETRLLRAAPPTVRFYRFLYDAVGAPWHWTDRKGLSDEALRRLISRPEVAVHVLYVHGTPAGYVELNARQPGAVQIEYFGLMPEFIGRGLGGYLMDAALRLAWAGAPERVWLHTCSLDHPRALAFYQSAGFEVYRTEVEHVKIGARPNMTPHGA